MLTSLPPLEVFGVGAAGSVWATWRPSLADLVAGQVWRPRSSGAEAHKKKPGMTRFWQGDQDISWISFFQFLPCFRIGETLLKIVKGKDVNGVKHGETPDGS